MLNLKVNNLNMIILFLVVLSGCQSNSSTNNQGIAIKFSTNEKSTIILTSLSSQDNGASNSNQGFIFEKTYSKLLKPVPTFL